MGFGSVGKDSCIETDLGHRRLSSQIENLYIVYVRLALRLNSTAIILEVPPFEAYVW